MCSWHALEVIIPAALDENYQSTASRLAQVILRLCFGDSSNSVVVNANFERRKKQLQKKIAGIKFLLLRERLLRTLLEWIKWIECHLSIEARISKIRVTAELTQYRKAERKFEFMAMIGLRMQAAAKRPRKQRRAQSQEKKTPRNGCRVTSNGLQISYAPTTHDRQDYLFLSFFWSRILLSIYSSRTENFRRMIWKDANYIR